MESKAKALGHPIHPMLIVFPLGLLVSAVVFDIIHLVTQNDVFATIAFYNIAGGVLGGLLAAVFGFWDWLAVPAGTRAKSIGLLHGLGNVVVVALFLISWLIRRDDPNFIPSTMALVFSFGGVLVGTLTAWLGGELVYRLNVGVDEGAHLNAPNSLSDQPASAGSRRRAAIPVTGENADEDAANRDRR